MTNGWAILVVIIAIGALAYFGVLNPSKFLPASCVLLPGLSCSDFKVNTTTITVVVRNGMGENLNPFWINISSSNSVCAGQGTPNATATLPDGNLRTFYIGNTGCSLGTASSRFKTDLVVTYTTS